MPKNPKADPFRATRMEGLARMAERGRQRTRTTDGNTATASISHMRISVALMSDPDFPYGNGHFGAHLSGNQYEPYIDEDLSRLMRDQEAMKAAERRNG